jgi:hypothetical protein
LQKINGLNARHSNLTPFIRLDMYTGSPTSLVERIEQETELQENLGAAAQALASAKRRAQAIWNYTDQELDKMPIFWVFRSGPLATPEIWDNDLLAMSGQQTKGGLWAPNVLDYLRGINDVNRPKALKWATSQGIVRGPGQSLDEYPFASTKQGGDKDWLRVEPVAISEQDTQRDQLKNFYRGQGFNPFKFLVVLLP